MNRHILITGASRGIGKAIALAFAGEKDHLFLTCREKTGSLLEVRELAERAGSSVEIFTGDLSSPEEISRLLDAYRASHKRLDILVNNAGISHFSLFQDSSDAALSALVNADLLSVLRLSKEALKLMIPRHEGRIINISSVCGIYGASCEAEYSACKGAVNAFTKALAKEVAGSGIAVNAVAPGYIDTDMNARLTPEERLALSEEIPAGRAGTPEEIGETVRLLARMPVYLTGQILEVSGGWF